MKNPHLVTQALLVLLIGIQAAGMWLHPAVAPAPNVPVQPANSALADAAESYRDNFGPRFASLGDAVRTGRVLTKQLGVDYLATGRKSLGDALDATFDAHCDKDGNVTDAAGLAAELDRAAKALGAK